MRFKENQLIAEAYAKVYEAKKKPSAGLTRKQKSGVAKKAMNEYYNNHIMSEEDVYDTNSIERVILQFTDSDGEFYQLPPLEYEEDTGNWTAYYVDTFAFIDKDALQNVFVEVQVRTKPNAPQPKKVIFQLSDADGFSHQVPLEYHEDTGNWADTTDLFNLLDKDLLQNPYVEVQVHS